MTTASEFDVWPYEALAKLTADIAAAWPYGPVRVMRLPRHLARDGYGRCHVKRRVIMYADLCPLWVVAHEMAHLMTPADEAHGEAWQAAYAQLAGWLLRARVVRGAGPAV